MGALASALLGVFRHDRRSQRRRADAYGRATTPAWTGVINFTNAGAVVGPDPLKARLDLWQKLWSRGGWVWIEECSLSRGTEFKNRAAAPR